VGLVPLIPFIIPDLSMDTRFFASAVATAIAFFEVGAAKGAVLHRSALHSGFETLLTGGGAALLAYVVGAWLRAAYQEMNDTGKTLYNPVRISTQPGINAATKNPSLG